MSLCCELGYEEEYRRLLAQGWLADEGMLSMLSNSANSNSLRTARVGMNLTNVLLDHGHISESWSYEAQLAFVK